MGTQELKNHIYQELINSHGKEVVVFYKKKIKSLNITVSFQRHEWWAREHFSKKMYHSDMHRVVLFWFFLYCILQQNTHGEHYRRKNTR